jgi:alpha-L-arabinofuranosidase
LPLPWEPLNPQQGNRYEPHWGNAANSWRSLSILGLPGQETGVKQEVFLPVHRELRYTGSIYVKHLSGPNRIAISIRRHDHPDEVFCRTSFKANSTDWQKYPFSLNVPRDHLQALEPVDFVIEVEEDERAMVDEVSLMPADAIDGMDPDVIAMAKSMHTSLLRFGGNFTSAYHWRDGTGPRDKRISMLNIAWGMPEYNQFGTDEFLQFCELIGARPQIALNLGSGTPQEAADWVRYVDEHWPAHGGLLWELGNELWGNWNLGYPTLDELAERTRQFSKAVHRVDPTAQLIATGADPDRYEEWNAAQLTNRPDTFDFLSTHFVVTTNHIQVPNPSREFVAEASFALPVELGQRLHAMQAQIDKTKFRDKARIAFTEWLFLCCGKQDIADAPRYDNMAGAIDTAGFLNTLIENADVVPVADMTGILEFAGIWKKRSRVYGTPAYYVFRLYSSADIEVPVSAESDCKHYDVHQGVERLPEILNVPYLDIVAALNKKGDRLTLFCVNRHSSEDIPADISLAGFSVSEAATVESLTAPNIYDGNTETQPEAIVPVQSTVRLNGDHLSYTFPHASVTRIELRTTAQ